MNDGTINKLRRVLAGESVEFSADEIADDPDLAHLLGVEITHEPVAMTIVVDKEGGSDAKS